MSQFRSRTRRVRFVPVQSKLNVKYLSRAFRVIRTRYNIKFNNFDEKRSAVARLFDYSVQYSVTLYHTRVRGVNIVMAGKCDKLYVKKSGYYVYIDFFFFVFRCIYFMITIVV